MSNAFTTEAVPDGSGNSRSLDGIHRLQHWNLLVLDGDPKSLRNLSRLLRDLGAQVTAMSSLREARLALESFAPDGILTNLQLKDGSGLSLLPEYLSRHPDGVFYILASHGSIEQAVKALRQGARYFAEKPFDPAVLVRQLAQDLAATTRSHHRLSEQLSPYLSLCDPKMLEALQDLPRFARSRESVLIQGETGTGKELVARALHGLSPRASGPFVAVNCGAIPASMLEAELFGYEKGAFTGAIRRHRGRFEQAHQGTLFLDEIGEMSPAAQVSLLRVLEEGVVHRVGSEQGTTVDVRVVAATHRPLEERIQSGLFRQDLLFRLNVLVVQLPPLRERPEDVACLARRFLAKSLADMDRSGCVPSFSQEALALLRTYRWPGNVRELRNLMARLAIRLPEGMREISPQFLRPLLPVQPVDRSTGVLIPRGTTLAEAEWLLIDAALKEANYNRTRAAKLLGISERTLRRKLNGH